MTSHKEILERRERVYRYRLRGFTISEIARIEQKAPSRIKEDFRVLKQEGRRFFTSNARLRQRLSNYFRDSLNALLEMEREAWIQYAGAKENVAIRVQALTLVHKIRCSINNLLGLTGLTLREIEREERLQKLERRANEIEASFHVRRFGNSLGEDLQRP